MVAEVGGFLKFQDFVEGITVVEQVDDVTGLSSYLIMDPKQRGMSSRDLRPTATAECQGSGNLLCEH